MIHALAFALNLLDSPALAVQAKVRAYVEATRTFDVKALDALLHPAYVEVSPLGEVDERSRVLSFYTVPADRRPALPSEIGIDEFSTRFPSKDVAVAVFRETAMLGESRRGFRITAVLKRERSTWFLFSMQATALRSAKPNP